MDKPEEQESNEISVSDENTAKNKSKIRPKKRKRVDSDTSTDGDDVLPENILDVERSLQASAIKNNLDDVSVKKILKKVVTNDHVLALVKLREEEEDSGAEDGLRPKLTRAKAKELMKVSRNAAPWNLELTPIKHIPVKTRPEVKALIAQELPEDEDDDEYQPTPDDVMSDDDHILESCSDLDSQPRTPATPRSQKKASPKVVQDGPFKVPQGVSEVCKKLDLDREEEATIALRTRSKLSLSSTPIEHIESSFVPPDYLPVPDVDDLWNDFLKECLNPAPNVRNEDDDETDPEYSVAADPDANEEDEEALENSIIKISKKELSDLVTELFHIIPSGAAEQLIAEENNCESTNIWEGKQEPVSDDESKGVVAAKIQFEKRESMTRFSIGKADPDEIDEYRLTIDTEAHVDKVSEENVIDTPVSEALPVREVSVAAPKVTISVDERETEAGPPPPAPLRGLLNAPPVTVNIQVDDAVEEDPSSDNRTSCSEIPASSLSTTPSNLNSFEFEETDSSLSLSQLEQPVSSSKSPSPLLLLPNPYAKSKKKTKFKKQSYKENIKKPIDRPQTIKAQVSSKMDAEDEFSYFGKNIACQLRQVPLKDALDLQCDIMEMIKRKRKFMKNS